MTSPTPIRLLRRAGALAAAATVASALVGASAALAQNSKSTHPAPIIVGLDSAGTEALLACRRLEAYGQHVVAAKLETLREQGKLSATLDSMTGEVQRGKYNDAISARFGLATLPDSLRPLVSKARKGCGAVPPPSQLRQLVRVETNKMPRMGINLQPLTPQLAAQHGLKDTLGLLVGGVTPNTGAQAAGIVPGDVIVSIGDKPVTTLPELRAASAGWKNGDKVKVGLLRKGVRQDVTVEVRGNS